MRRPPKRRAARKGSPRRRTVAARPEPDPLDDFVAVAARSLDLTLDKSWHPAVRTHLRVTLMHGAKVASFALPDDTEPAPVFKA